MQRERPEETFEDFFVRASPKLVGQAYLLTGDTDAARDLAQEAMLRVWEHWERVRGLDDPEAWSRRVLHNLAVGRWRRLRSEWRHRTSAIEGGDIELDHVALEVGRVLRSLPMRLRQVLVLRAVAGLDTSEIAVELGASEATVRVWLSRARREAIRALEVVVNEETQ